MARLPYADLSDDAAVAVARQVVKERGSLLHIYSMLLHSPPVAAGWLRFLTAIRQQTTLAPRLRELVIMRIAGLNGASYEADVHAPIARREGVSTRQLEALGNWQATDLFDHEERLVLALTDQMTREIQVSDALIAEAQASFGVQGTVELVATIATYNMVSRFLESLGIRHEDDLPYGVPDAEQAAEGTRYQVSHWAK